jgi:hypothetical protein
MFTCALRRPLVFPSPGERHAALVGSPGVAAMWVAWRACGRGGADSGGAGALMSCGPTSAPAATRLLLPALQQTTLPRSIFSGACWADPWHHP